MYGWLTFYHQGHEVATDFKPHMLELQARIQKVSEAWCLQGSAKRLWLGLVNFFPAVAYQF